MLRIKSKSGNFIALLHEPLGKCGFDVIATKWGVDAFRDRWPCSRLPHRMIKFGFASNGDLVDLNTDYDGEDLLALSQDAKEFAEKCIERRLAQ